jgi:hypothetical protein
MNQVTFPAAAVAAGVFDAAWKAGALLPLYSAGIGGRPGWLSYGIDDDDGNGSIDATWCDPERPFCVIVRNNDTFENTYCELVAQRHLLAVCNLLMTDDADRNALAQNGKFSPRQTILISQPEA